MFRRVCQWFQDTWSWICPPRREDPEIREWGVAYPPVSTVAWPARTGGSSREHGVGSGGVYDGLRSNRTSDPNFVEASSDTGAVQGGSEAPNWDSEIEI